MEETYKKAIKIFEEVRDIPYHISLNKEDPCYDCVGKNSILAKRLSKIGYKVRARTGFFHWSDINLPSKVTDIKHDNNCSHYFLEVLPPGKTEWVVVDATWNKELGKLDYPIATWDGFSSTKIAFPCTNYLDAKSEEEYEESIDYDQDIKKNGRFYKALNIYFNSVLKE